jgi:hypothetical protein
MMLRVVCLLTLNIELYTVSAINAMCLSTIYNLLFGIDCSSVVANAD